MTASTRPRRVARGAEVGLALGVGAAAFALVAVAVAVVESDVLVAVLGVVCALAVVAIERAWGIAYAVPAAMAALLAYDWYQFPPTHPHAFPDAANLANLLVYLGVAVLIGELAAHASRRADVSEEARSRLAQEQAALRRVATLVARRAAPEDVFAAVAAEVCALLDVDGARVVRWEGAADPSRDAVVPAAVRELGIPSAVGAPIVVDGRPWGAMLAWSPDRPLLAETAEARLADFTELVATAISNAASREELARLADEQAALRRVATLVARECSPAEVFMAVATEVGGLLGTSHTTLFRYEDDGTATVVADGRRRDAPIPVGTRVTLEGENVTAMVRRTGRPARIDEYAKATGSLAEHVRGVGIRSAVASPIMVGGRVWGAMVVGSRLDEPLPAGAEARIGEFTALAATAISNIEARSELAASRARIVAATDQERRRLVRDLHDGAQQRLVHTVITLKLARQALREGKASAAALVGEALDHAERATTEVRELAHGILPSVLTHGGLRAGVDALAARMPVPVETDVAVGRLPAPVEATAYFVVAEALTNVAKHARAEHAAVVARVENGTLRLGVRDDGVGGARADGSGLVGLADRLAVLDGRLRVESPAEGGTLVAAAIPLAGRVRGH